MMCFFHVLDVENRRKRETPIDLWWRLWASKSTNRKMPSTPSSARKRTSEIASGSPAARSSPVTRSKASSAVVDRASPNKAKSNKAPPPPVSSSSHEAHVDRAVGVCSDGTRAICIRVSARARARSGRRRISSHVTFFAHVDVRTHCCAYAYAYVCVCARARRLSNATIARSVLVQMALALVTVAMASVLVESQRLALVHVVADVGEW